MRILPAPAARQLMQARGAEKRPLACVALLGLLFGCCDATTPDLASGSWNDLSNAESYSFASNRLNFPTGTMPASGALSGLGQIFNNTPPYAISSVRFLYANFFVVMDGSRNPERTPGNDNSIDFATVFVNGEAYPLTFNGASSIVLSDGAFAWTDPLRDKTGKIVTLPANSSYFIRTSRSVSANGKLVAGSGNFGVLPRLSHGRVGDGVEYTSAPQINKRTSGDVAAYLMGSAAIGPSMAIGKGWDGSPVYLLVGDSIGVGQGDFDFGARGVIGYLGRGLDDDAHAKRRNFATMTSSGTRPDDQSSTEAGQYKLRMSALRSIPNRPFDVIISEMGQNSISIAGHSLAAFQEVETKWWDFWHETCPKCTIYQTTFPTRAGSGNSKWTVQQDQSGDYPDGMRWQASNWFRRGPLPAFVRVLDITPAFCDSVNPGFWKTSDWAGTTATAVAPGDARVLINGARAPSNGDALVIAPGAADVETRNIYDVAGSGPWTVSVTQAFSKPHPTGSPAALAYTTDGAHPTSTLYKAAASMIERYKAAGVLR
jgi:hypothetical protein